MTSPTSPTAAQDAPHAFTIRPAMPGDAAALQRIYSGIISTADWLPEEARHRTDFAAASEGEVVHVAVDAQDNTQVLGFIAVWEPDAFIHHLFIEPTAQRRGIGRALLASLNDGSPRPWWLKCSLANTQAHAFYLAQGWQEGPRGVSDHGPYVEMHKSQCSK